MRHAEAKFIRKFGKQTLQQCALAGPGGAAQYKRARAKYRLWHSLRGRRRRAAAAASAAECAIYNEQKAYHGAGY